MRLRGGLINGEKGFSATFLLLGCYFGFRSLRPALISKRTRFISCAREKAYWKEYGNEELSNGSGGNRYDETAHLEGLYSGRRLMEKTRPTRH